MSVRFVSTDFGAIAPSPSAPVVVERGKGTSTFLSRIPALICRANLFLFGEYYGGSHVKGLRSGKGVYRREDGVRYDGDFQNDKFHGHGVLRYANGDCYEGDFENGKLHGTGILKYADGSTYSGRWKEGVWHGQGTYLFANGGCYEGDFENGKLHGTGILTYADGAKYSGKWKEGVWHGQGTYIFASGGRRYDGDFENGKLHGTGILTRVGSVKYSGEWKEGVRHGRGFLQYSNGDYYEGEWEEGVRHGHGLLVYANGDHYEGEWKEGVRHGRGTHVFVNGDRYEGNWENDAAIVTADPARSPIRSKLVSALLAQDSDVFATNPGLGLGVLIRVFLGFEMFVADPSAIAMLQRACDLHRATFPEIFGEIRKALLHEGEGILYPYESQSHAVGLGMQRRGDRIEIRVFNSGEGLDKFHYSAGKDFATAWVIQVPYCEMSLHAIQKIIEEGRRDPTLALYEKLLAIPGCERQTVLPPVLQTRQKGENCSIEWIFAYLRNSLPEEKYHRLRIELFKKCLEWTDSEELKAELKRKIAKREAKLAGFL